MKRTLLIAATAIALSASAAHADEYVGQWIDVAHHTNTVDEGRLDYAKDTCGRPNPVTRAYFVCMRKTGYAWRQDTPTDIKARQDAETARRWRILGETAIEVFGNPPPQPLQCNTQAYMNGHYTTTCR